MSAALTHLQAFQPLRRQGDTLALPVRTEEGLHHFVAPVRVWRELVLQLSAALGLSAVSHGGAGAAGRSGRGRGLGPEQVALLREAFDRRDDPGVTRTALAAECGVSAPTLARYFARFEAPSPPKPALKPNGQIL